MKELRQEQKLSQTELAKILGVSQRVISNWERGEREPDFEMLEKIANFFHVSFDYLLGFAN